MPLAKISSPYNVVNIRLKDMQGGSFVEKLDRLKNLLFEEERSDLIQKWFNNFLNDNPSPSDEDYMDLSKSIDRKLDLVREDLVLGIELKVIKLVFKWFNECLKEESLDDLTGVDYKSKEHNPLLFDFYKKYISKDVIYKLNLQIFKISKVLNSLNLEIFSKNFKSKNIRAKLSQGECLNGKNLEEIKLELVETIELISNDGDISLKLLPSSLYFTY